MRILMLSDFYPPSIGGIERHVQTLSRELVQRGHHVAVATLQHRGSPAFEDDEGVRIHRLAGWKQMLAPFYQDQKHPFHPPFPDPSVMASLRRVVKQERPDIVHAHKWILYSFIGLKAWSGAKLVVTLHDTSLICPTMTYLHNGQVCNGPSYLKCVRCASSHYGRGKGFLLSSGMKLSSYLHRYVDKYIAVSSAMRNASIRGTGYPPKPIEVVPTFISGMGEDEASHSKRPTFLPPKDNYILFVGRDSATKGIDVLLEAYAELSDLAPLVLMIAEPSNTRKRFPAGVIVACNVPHAQVMAGWKHCAVGVVPSILPDACPTVAMEAMAMERPVIGSRIGGLPDIIVDGKSGLLVEPGNVSALREALRALLVDPARRAQMGAIGRQRARLFTIGTIANQIEQIYMELLNN
jgi:glycosyltransferase involved in cell wall biosynthesis